MARQAFKFCLKHNRRVEFRRLCETLRLHLANIAKYSQQPHAINLSDPDTLQRHLDTRFAQLSAAVELELWQEAFRTVEDIHNLLTLAKKTPRPSMMAGYYEKLTRIFLMSGSGLYHAAAWNKYYSIVRVNPAANVAKLPDDEDMSKLAGLVLLSALAVPLHSESQEQSTSKVSRLISLLGMTKMPNRASLLASALASCTVKDVPLLKTVPAPIHALYRLIEVSFDPLHICEKAAPLLLQLETDFDGIYKPYVASLRDVILNRLLLQTSRAYETIEMKRLLNMAQAIHVDGDLDAKFEGIIVHTARRGDLSVKIDHALGLVLFQDDVFAPVEEAGESSKQTYRSARSHLSSVAETLAHVTRSIEPATSPQLDFKGLAQAAEAERKALTLRRNIVARRRELQSELHARKEKEEAGRRAEASRREKDEEAKRAIQDVRRKELERAKKMQEEIRTEEVMRLARSLKERGNLKVDMDVSDNIFFTRGVLNPRRTWKLSTPKASCDFRWNSSRRRSESRVNARASLQSD
jgi:translation initiation factor 3 subunit A